MPTTTQIGNPSAANDKIGGVPTIHYFDFQSRGRGQVLRLMWEDAGIAYKDVRYTFDEYPSYKEAKIAELNPTATIPVVELNGKILTQSYAILRHFSRLLGAYDGKNEEEKYWADLICDIVIDWRTLFIQAFFSNNKDTTYPEHCKTVRPNFLRAINTHLESSDVASAGPYVCGNTFTYADMVLYQILHDENLVQEGRAGLKGQERLAKVVDAVEGRERIKKWLGSERYLG
ncbi:glutathione S-transferase [Pleomassaria siparia CBS 279.74]|uniref:Glutathione S-transferase n=1 Tax=Pleomassaria siparia CBS 279.74 TaxID=1314801 RepID=A0A6G1K1Q9_9PLEO|nr:glutathione S-transferase [Pleomassaria siparia CBS 279.74]